MEITYENNMIWVTEEKCLQYLNELIKKYQETRNIEIFETIIRLGTIINNSGNFTRNQKESAYRFLKTVSEPSNSHKLFELTSQYEQDLSISLHSNRSSESSNQNSVHSSDISDASNQARTSGSPKDSNSTNLTNRNDDSYQSSHSKNEPLNSSGDPISPINRMTRRTFFNSPACADSSSTISLFGLNSNNNVGSPAFSGASNSSLNMTGYGDRSQSSLKACIAAFLRRDMLRDQDLSNSGGSANANITNSNQNDERFNSSALARNAILMDNQIGAEGAKALACNKILPTLEVSANQIGDEDENLNMTGHVNGSASSVDAIREEEHFLSNTAGSANANITNSNNNSDERYNGSFVTHRKKDSKPESDRARSQSVGSESVSRTNSYDAHDERVNGSFVTHRKK